MQLQKSSDLLTLPVGNTVSKRNLFDLIQYSKVEGSSFWSGSDAVIGNTPQQGINWIGELPDLRAVVIKVRPGAHEGDGWSDDSQSSYCYSFKARKGDISFAEKANDVLIQQPHHGYPILLFIDTGGEWLFEGRFSVVAIESTLVVLARGESGAAVPAPTQEDITHKEGARKYVTHLMAERSQGVVKALKGNVEWTCDICGNDFLTRYGVPYIEAHHKVPISTYAASHEVTKDDLALLCPNCHRAVHIYMRRDGLDYLEIKAALMAL